MEYTIKLDNLCQKISSIKKNSKTKLNFSFLFNSKRILILFAISVIITIFIAYMQYLIITYSIIPSILLIIFLGLKFIFNEINMDNPIIKFIRENSTFMITPLLVIFINIIVYKAMNVLGI